MYSGFFSPKLIRPIQQRLMTTNVAPAFQVVHFSPNQTAFSSNPQGLFSFISEPFKNAFAPPSRKFISTDELTKVKLFAEAILQRGGDCHVDNINQGVHTHFSTPEFTFYPKSGPFNISQFQELFRLIKQISSSLPPAVSWHLASFPIMVPRTIIEELRSQDDLLAQEIVDAEEFSFKDHLLVNIGILGQGDRLVVYSKQIPSSVDFAYPKNRMVESIQDLDDHKDYSHFGSLKFDKRHFEIKLFPPHKHLLLLFDMCNDHSHSIALHALEKIISREINAMYEIVASGVDGIRIENSPAILVDVNDLQQGSQLLIIKNAAFTPIPTISSIINSSTEKSVFGQGYKETRYTAPLGYGLNRNIKSEVSLSNDDSNFLPPNFKL